MPKDHARKNRTRQRQAQTGARYTSAHAGTDHQHPAPDLPMLAELPYGTGRSVDLDLAARLIGACRAGCGPCQGSLISQVLGLPDRATVATIAGAVYGLLPSAGPLAAAATRTWQPLAQRAHRSGQAAPALEALEAMTSEQVAELLDDALDHWAVGGMDPGMISLTDPATLLGDAPGTEPPTGPASSPPTGLVSYALCPAVVPGPGDRPVPALVFEPETAAAEAEDLRARCDWPQWNLDGLPAVRTDWRLRVQIATRSLVQVARVAADGVDDLIIWDAGQAVPLPQEWFDLLDRAQHVVLCGPSAPGEEALQAAARGDRFGAVTARVSFW
ncbi:hypothetical protein [Actinomadura sp. NPDC048394]|uniref:hypothetical protein n=1 Tax=Actinomadura sp. NPDC048394 TaxID=3158223 RepID=UPI0033F44FBD